MVYFIYSIKLSNRKNSIFSLYAKFLDFCCIFGFVRVRPKIAPNKGLTQLRKSQDAINEADTKIFGNSDFKGSQKYLNGFAPAGTSEQSFAKKGHERWSNKITGRTEKKMAGTGYGGYFDGDGNPRFNIKDGIPARNKRSVWTVTTKPYSEAHFATFPENLIKDCVLAGYPEQGVILDPFMGAGTTALVARKLNRNYVGIELNNKYIRIAEKRLQDELGMFT